MTRRQRTMRFGYWMYHVKHISGDRFRLDIRNLLSAYCSLNNREFKRGFKYDGNHVFVFQQQLNLFMFVMTRSDEIVKKVDTQEIEVTDIEAMLSNDEELGYASFVYLRDDHMAYGTTFMAPRTNAFADFVTQLFASTGHMEYQLVAEPALKETTAQAALEIPFVGRTQIQIRSDSPWFQDVAGSMGIGNDVDEFSNIEEFEVIIKPKFRRTITTPIRSLMRRFQGNGIGKLTIRGKAEERDRMLDHFIVGSGQIGDDVTVSDPIRLSNSLETRLLSNAEFASQLATWREDETWSDIGTCRVSVLGDDAAWPRPVPGVQPAGRNGVDQGTGSGG